MTRLRGKGRDVCLRGDPPTHPHALHLRSGQCRYEYRAALQRWVAGVGAWRARAVVPAVYVATCGRRARATPRRCVNVNKSKTAIRCENLDFGKYRSKKMIE